MLTFSFQIEARATQGTHFGMRPLFMRPHDPLYYVSVYMYVYMGYYNKPKQTMDMIYAHVYGSCIDRQGDHHAYYMTHLNYLTEVTT